MPSLMAIVGANANPFRREMLATSQVANAAGQQTIRVLKEMATTLEEQVQYVKATGGAWETYANKLSAVRTEIHALTVDMNKADAARFAASASQAGPDPRAVNAQDALAWEKKLAAFRLAKGASGLTKEGDELVRAKKAAEGLRDATKGMDHIKSGAFGEALVILREIGRGNWARVPGSISILIQRLGLLKLVLNPIGAAMLAAGAAAFFFWEHFKKVNEELEQTNKLFSEGFGGNMGLAMKNAMKDAAAAAADFNSWIKELGVSHDTLADKLEKELDLLHEEARLQREVAASRGVSKTKLDKNDLANKEKELKLVTETLKQQSEVTKNSAEAARQATMAALTGPEARARAARMENSPAERAAAEEKKKLYEGIVPKLQEVFDERVAHLKTSPEYFNPDPAKRAGNIATLTTAAADEIQRITIDGKEYRMSLNQARGLLEKYSASLRSIDAEQVRLAAIQRELAEAAKNTRQRTEKEVAALAKLTAERDKLIRDIALHKKYDPLMGNKTGAGGGNKDLNTLQKIGLMAIGENPILDVNRRMERHLAFIASVFNQGRNPPPRKMGGVRH